MRINRHFPATIPCDWGYAFDYLSIFEVKATKIGDDKSKKNLMSAHSHLAPQFRDLNLFADILESDEYKKLVEVNTRLFDLVDDAKTDKVKASEVDAGVWERYLAKKALQDKFFPENILNEQKVGYKQ